MWQFVWVRNLLRLLILTSMMSVNMSAVSAVGVVGDNKTVSSEQSEPLVKQERFTQTDVVMKGLQAVDMRPFLFMVWGCSFKFWIC